MQEPIPQAVTSSNSPEEDIRGEQMALLIEQSYPAAYISLVVAGVLVAILWPAQSPAQLLTWYGAILACGMLRLAVFIGYRRSPPAPDRLRFLERAYFGAAMLYFLCWGLGGVWLMPADSPVHQVTILYFLIGLAGSAIAVFSASRAVQLGAVAALLLPILAWYYARADFQSIGMAVAGTIFLLSAIRSSKVLSRAMGQNLRLKYKLMQAKADAERLARIDELTGQFNRRALYEQLELQVAQARRSGDPLSLVLLDVDRFKEINDRNGHRVGDRALQHVANLLSSSLRGSDICGRVGGEEFAVILPNTPLDYAMEVAEYLRSTLERSPFEHDGRTSRITASFGVAQGCEPGCELAQRADEAMYRAKAAGRNCVERAVPCESSENSWESTDTRVRA